MADLVHNLEITFDRAGERIAALVVVAADGEENRTVTVPPATADKRLRISIDVSELKLLYVHSDQAVTIETNSGTVPADTLTVLANKPLAWYAGCGLANPFTADVTDLYLTNAGARPATVRVLGLVDATPSGGSPPPPPPFSPSLDFSDARNSQYAGAIL